MSKAEEAAMKAYPVKEEWVGNQYGYLADVNATARKKYQEGYEQAEKDVIAMVKKYLEMGHRCMEQSLKYDDESSYTIFWDGFHSCAENILRELENKE